LEPREINKKGKKKKSVDSLPSEMKNKSGPELAGKMPACQDRLEAYPPLLL